MKVLITGGNGMVARNISHLAENQNFDLVAPSRSELDLLDYEKTLAFIQNFKPDAVVHCAGQVGGIQANMADPTGFFFNNIQMGLNIVRASQQTNIENLINLGSSCMYPRNAQNPLKESQVLQGELEPTNEGYALAKISTARYCDYLNQQFGVAYKTLIPCNLYGYWDKFDPQKSHMIPAVIRKIHEAHSNKQEVVDIWGSGNARREFMFSLDLADFILQALPKLDQLKQYTNIGIGDDHSINEFYQIIAKIIGYKGSFEHDLSKPEGMNQKLVDITEQSNFGWSPATSLEEGIEKTYQFFLEHY